MGTNSQLRFDWTAPRPRPEEVRLLVTYQEMARFVARVRKGGIAHLQHLLRLVTAAIEAEPITDEDVGF